MFQYHEKEKNDTPRVTGRVSDTGGRLESRGWVV